MWKATVPGSLIQKLHQNLQVSMSKSCLYHQLWPYNFHDVVVSQPVTVVKDISNQSVFVGKEALFECEIKINYPEITLSWYKGTQKLDSGDKYDITVIDDRHLLKIKKCQLADQGNYRVVCGPHISSAKLTVTGQYCLMTCGSIF